MFSRLCLILFCLSLGNVAKADWRDQIKAMVSHGGVLAVSEKGKPLFMLNIDQKFMPASTLKVVTSLSALKELGENFRFPTELYLDSQNILYIKGYGDPFLISEELAQMAAAIAAKGIKTINGIVLDTSFYDKNIEISGRSQTLNPYDAQPAALAANFNTIYVYKNSKGEVSSAEIQTPITELTRILAKKAPVGKSRISLVNHPEEAVLYVGYLLKEFLLENKIQVSGSIRAGLVASQAKLVLSYKNSRTLKEILKNALEYSQNLVMNQVFLMVGVKKKGAPATIAKGKEAVTQFLKTEVGLQDFSVEEGSGLSRQNKLSPAQMDRILVAFFPYRKILPAKDNILYKTGTLNGVATLVGYFQSATHGWVRFSILLNQGANYREKIVKVLYDNLQ